MPKPIDKISNFKVRRAKLREVLWVLENMPERKVESNAGQATKLIVDHLSFSEARETINVILRDLEGAGWIRRDKRQSAKRTYAIEMIASSEAVLREAKKNPDLGASGPAKEPTPKPEPQPQPKERDEEAEEIGGRPGRLAARIAKELPELVRSAVHEAMLHDRDTQMAALGYYRGVDQEGYERVLAEVQGYEAQVALLQTTIEDLSEEGIRTQAMLDYMLDEEDARLPRTNDGTPAMKGSMTASQLPDVFRDVGRQALAAGWTIKKTRGTHLAWTSPEKKVVYSGSTPVPNAVHILTRKLRRAGLNLEGRPALESADVDRMSGFRNQGPGKGSES